MTASSTQVTILPGFPTGLATNISTDPSSPTFATTDLHPFGIWFANATTLYVADEGDGVNTTANAPNPNGGLQKWTLSAGTWHLDYTLQNGLGLGTQYSIAGLDPSLYPATDGLRNLTGKVNRDGTATIFAISSTISNSGDQGADTNRLVADRLAATSLPADEQFQFWRPPALDRFSAVWFSPRAGTRKVGKTRAVWIDTRGGRAFFHGEPNPAKLVMVTDPLVATALPRTASTMMEVSKSS